MGNDSEKTRKHRDFNPKTASSVERKTNVKMQFGKYQLLEEIGQGEFGCVYRASDDKFEESGKYYAVKILKSRRNLRRFQQECRILQTLAHKALPKFIEAGNSQAKDGFDGSAYLVMEFVAGSTLRNLLTQKRQTSVETALSWCYELAEGVRYLHTNGVVHCDLKPSNVMISWSPKLGRQLRILDLGIAMLRDKKAQDISGSARYMSPEQMEGNQGKPGDVYSLGLILYELLNGTYPYDTLGASQDWWKIHHDIWPKPISNQAISPKIAEMVLKCLEKKPERRPSVETVADTLRQEIAGVGIPSYIGIYGPRGSGKTCYLTSLYHEAEVCAQTRRALEKLYLDLFEKGRVPPPTILAARRLNFQINTPSKYYDIVTKDYGGELLEGRRDDPLQAEDSGLLKEKRDEVYEFFQNARAILIIVETIPGELNLRKINDHKKEIESLTNKIARVQQGVKKSNVPLALLLTKWDRLGNISWNPESEKRRAMEYIKQREWLTRLYEKLKILYPEMELFPVFSFIGDKPKKNDIKAFNLCAPLIWATDKAEQNMLQKCEQFEQDRRDYPNDYRYVIENYWRLIYVEKLSDAKAAEKVQGKLGELAQKYLAAVDRQAVEYSRRKGNARMAARYREVASTRGIGSEIKQSAIKRAEKYRRKGRRQERRKWLAIATILAMLLCAVLAAAAYLPKLQRQKDLQRDCQIMITDFQRMEKLYAEMSLKDMHLNVLPETSKSLDKLAKLQNRLAEYRRENPNSSFYSKVENMQRSLSDFSPRWKLKQQQMSEIDELYIQLASLDTKSFSHSLSQIKTAHQWQSKKAQIEINLQKLQKLRRDWQAIIDNYRKPSLLAAAMQQYAQRIEQTQELWTAQMRDIERWQAKIPLAILNAQTRQLEKLDEWAKLRWEEYCQGQALDKKEIEKRIVLVRERLAEVEEITLVFGKGYQAKIDNGQKSGELVLEFYRKLLTQIDIHRQAGELLTSLGKMDIASILGIFPLKDDPEALLKIKCKKIEERLLLLGGQSRALGEFLKRYPDYRHKNSIAKAKKKCVALITHLEAEYKKCKPFLRIHDLVRIAQQGTVQSNDYDSPRDISKKIEQVRKAREELRKIAEGFVNLEKKRQELDRDLAAIEIRLSALDKQLVTLEQKCKNLQNNWQSKITQAQSYQAVWREAEELAGQISQGKLRNIYLSEKYRKELMAICQKIKEMRKKDRSGYKEIEDAVRAHRFQKASEEIWRYRNDVNHFHIMDKELERYQSDFSGMVSFTVYITPSDGFNDKGGGKPDFKLYITYNGEKTIFTQDDIDGRTEMGEINKGFSYGSNKQEWFYIWVVEVDPFSNDTYGNVSIDISKTFDNETVTQDYQCKEDGSITLEIEPAFTLNLSLPDFKD